MRLFKAMVILGAVLDIAMFLQSPSSPLSATSPTQVVGFTADNSDAPAVMARP
ncbi:MAG: hypothetical protein ACRYGF_06950 [Janthinobacterium lividum]